MDLIIQSAYWPLVVLGLSISLVILLIGRLHIHPFIALMVAAVFVGLISPPTSGA